MGSLLPYSFKADITMPAKIIHQLVPLKEVPPGDVFTKKTGEKEYRRIERVNQFEYGGKGGPKNLVAGNGIAAVPVTGMLAEGNLQIQLFPDPEVLVVWQRRIVIVDHATIREPPLCEGMKWEPGFYYIQSLDVEPNLMDEDK